MSAINIHVVIFYVLNKKLKNLDSLRSSESYFLYTCRVLLCNVINSKTVKLQTLKVFTIIVLCI